MKRKYIVGWWLTMERNINLESLPRRGKNIDWVSSVGYSVNFNYDGVDGVIEIIEYDNQYLKIKYENNVFRIKTGNLSNCILGVVIGKYKLTYEYRYQIGDIIENVNSGKLKILDQIKRKRGSKRSNARFYRYECLICGHKDTIWEISITNKGSGCAVCSSKQVRVGFNDIWTTNQELGKNLWNPSDGYKYTIGSNTKIDWRCPNCNHKITSKEISSIKNQGISCPKCSDGVSYPNKLMCNILIQTGLEFENEWSPSWATIDGNNKILNGRKFYDFYIPSLNCVIEMHGSQHYKITGRERRRNLEEEKANDLLKEELLIKNGVDYVLIDAQESNLEYIKLNILKSKIAKNIDLTIVDWEKSNKDSLNSLVLRACELFKNENLTTSEIGSILKTTYRTIIKYLKRGTEIGLCNYSADEEARKSRIKGNSISAERSKKAVLQFSLNGDFINEFDSAREASKHMGLSFSVIPAACAGKQQSAGGFRWMYKKDYNIKGKNINSYDIKRKSSSVVRMTLDGHYLNEYISIKSAEEELGINHSCISAVCSGKQKTAGGYRWMYKRDYYEKIM